MSARSDRQVRKFSNDEGAAPAVRPNNMGLPFAVIRTVQAGVHCGFVCNVSGQQVTLREARRVWRWRGANTLHELSQGGCDQEYSRISEMVPEIQLLDAIEVIPCSADAAENLQQSRWPA